MRYDRRLRRYLNGQAALERRTGEDAYGAAVYAPARVIPARTEAKARMVRTGTGAIVASGTTVYLCEKAEPLDRIDGKEVLFVSEWTDFSGRAVGYEAAL